ncbi:metal ABC transporter permease [Candidatus Nitrosocosmicus agrestis]|jgi:zinc transport system permease protein|uniref:metal ABC transporter permease n=1 Tax=Candidatus Nitrosocosmicus agrestis TaxID=2563600 RepID=UPI00122DC61A|nr:metal ABC transporter permease [Candidatus Nitrosocosmicus sp. SS]KAA2282856.1 metal ABC transporter permease [Candidatus Nitrosocosmicus sp. SS]KAF0869058.1 metal ABC transporter permease [Candidatus Nitrosocosmicus sp. SS]MDR4489595.1 metal ABC transporter permease [Candidatus Nitrosocosmicus sp.]
MFEVFEYEFMQRAIISGIAISISCTLIGLFLILKRFSLFGDAMSHVAFGGIALGLFLKSNPIWVSLVVSIIGGLSIIKLNSSKRVYADSSISVLLSLGLAMGLVLISLSGGFSIDITSYLFGSILLVNNTETLTTIILSIVVVAFVTAFYKKLVYLVFNEEQALVNGINTAILNILLITLATIAIVISIRLIGVLMVSSLLIIPNVSSLLLGYGFRKTILISICFSLLSVILGTILAYEWNITPSGMIVIMAAGIFFGVNLIKLIKSRLDKNPVKKVASSR